MKNPFKKAALAVLTVCLMASVFSGCSSQPNSSDTKSETTSKSSQINNGEPVKLVFAIWGSTYEKKVVTNLCKAYSAKNPNVEIVIQHIASDYEAKIQTMFAGKQQLDLLYAGTTNAVVWAKDGKLANIMDFMKNDTELNTNTLMPGTLPQYDEGKSAGVYLAIEPYAIYYNPSIFKENNIEEPPHDPSQMWTWDKFVEVAKRLTIDKNGNNMLDSASKFDNKNVKTYGFAFFPGNVYHWFSLTAQSGVDRLFDTNGKYLLDDAKMLNAFSNINDLINKDKVCPTMAQSSTLPVYGTSVVSGKIAMAVEGQWVNLDLGASGKTYNIAPMPRMSDSPSRAIVACNQLSITTSCKNQEVAWDVYKSILNPEFNITPYKEGLWMPVLKKWYEDEELFAKWAVNNPAHPSGWKGAFVDTIKENPILDPSAYIPNTASDFYKVTQDFDKFWNDSKADPKKIVAGIKDRAEKAVKSDFE